MSLVAYGASDDESETSDSGETEESMAVEGTHKSVISSSHISDEEEFETVSSTSIVSGTADFEFFKNQSGSGVASATVVNSTSINSLEDLPAPVRQDNKADEVTEEELEDEVKPKTYELSDAPKPPAKKTKQPVKITIPSLSETLDEEKSETKKKLGPATVKSGLFSLLPPPLHSAKKEINRPLIPHSLTKKPASSTSTSSKKQDLTKTGVEHSPSSKPSTDTSKRITAFNALTGYDSDSEDEDEKGNSNFFSLNSDSEVQKVKSQNSVPVTERLQSEEVSSSGGEAEAASKDSSEVLSQAEGDNEDAADEVEEEPLPEPGALNDAPLDFHSMNRLWAGSSYSFLGPVGPTGACPPPTSYTSYASSYMVPSNAQYNLANTEVSEDDIGDDGGTEVADDDIKQFMSDKEFQKFQGKRKRGMEEAINFVDANVDDYVDPSEVSKHLTEETTYVSHKKKDDAPTAQQRRKKQITYLAYQAKERELELKNTWAQNRMTKKQTQSKYGF